MKKFTNWIVNKAPFFGIICLAAFYLLMVVLTFSIMIACSMLAWRYIWGMDLLPGGM